MIKELFGNDHSLEIEIGCGKSGFLISRAAQNPQINFLGLDRVPFWFKTLKQVPPPHPENLQFIQTEISAFLDNSSFYDSTSIFHIYFPDPWPKRRHHRRRLLQPGFFRLIHRHLKEEGRVEIATDHADYAQFIRKSIQETKELWRDIRESFNVRLFEGTKTAYEQKFEREKRTLVYLELRK